MRFLALFIFDKFVRIFRVIQVLGVVMRVMVVKVTILHSYYDLSVIAWLVGFLEL